MTPARKEVFRYHCQAIDGAGEMVQSRDVRAKHQREAMLQFRAALREPEEVAAIRVVLLPDGYRTLNPSSGELEEWSSDRWAYSMRGGELLEGVAA